MKHQGTYISSGIAHTLLKWSLAHSSGMVAEDEHPLVSMMLQLISQSTPAAPVKVKREGGQCICGESGKGKWAEGVMPGESAAKKDKVEAVSCRKC
jgi:hypothetical protein